VELTSCRTDPPILPLPPPISTPKFTCRHAPRPPPIRQPCRAGPPAPWSAAVSAAGASSRQDRSKFSNRRFGRAQAPSRQFRDRLPEIPTSKHQGKSKLQAPLRAAGGPALGFAGVLRQAFDPSPSTGLGPRALPRGLELAVWSGRILTLPRERRPARGTAFRFHAELELGGSIKMRPFAALKPPFP
jgi:hypothetical protein